MEKKEKSLINIINDKYLHDKSLIEGYYKRNKNDYYPWYTYSAIEYIDQFNYKNKTVFEWGSGYSSIFWAERAKLINSIESDMSWYKKIRKKNKKNLFMFYRNEGPEYINVIRNINRKYDVIIIDGKNRLKCAEIAPNYLKKGGFIILDNADWFIKSSAILRKKGYLEIDFSGIGPVNNYTWTTSIFFDRNFNFQTINKIQPVHSLGSIKQYSKKE